MPRAKKSPSYNSSASDERPYSQRQTDPLWGGFLNLRLTEIEVTAFKEWYGSQGANLWVLFDDILTTSLKFSVGWDDANQCYIASFTGKLIPGQETRYATSARALTWEEATALLVYKHDVLADRNWANYMPKTGTLMQFG
jgi:hypothetical protein